MYFNSLLNSTDSGTYRVVLKKLRFEKNVVNFTPVIIRHTKLVFFISQFFSQKLTKRMDQTFYRLYSYLYSALS